MYVKAFFTDGFAPVTGLSPLPKLSILRVSDDTIVVNAQDMIESNLAGYYYYDFTTYDADEDYSMVADGGSALDNVERYKFGGIGEVGGIEAKVDQLLSDVADVQAEVDGLDGEAMRGTNNANTVVPDVAGVAAALHSITDGKIDVIQIDSTFIKDVEGGDWEREGNQMIFRKPGGAEVARFNLFKYDGSAATEVDVEVAKRERV